MSTLILGGVRSGKSRLAEALARDSGRPVTYIATATDLGDEEMRARIATHRDRRPPHWRTVEAPLQLADALRAHASPERFVLVDCLTLWLSNLLCSEDGDALDREREDLCEWMRVPSRAGGLVLVGNETGLGVVPVNALARRFVDEAGALHQRLAQACDRVVYTVAGLPQILKGPPL